jgi:hypothetical protein
MPELAPRVAVADGGNALSDSGVGDQRRSGRVPVHERLGREMGEEPPKANADNGNQHEQAEEYAQKGERASCVLMQLGLLFFWLYVQRRSGQFVAGRFTSSRVAFLQDHAS